MSYGRPKITIEDLPRRGTREDFNVRLVGPGATDYSFRLSVTYTALGIWRVEGYDAAGALAEVLAESHGTASAFPEEGFWFDSYSVGESLKGTCDLVRERGWKAFLVPAARESLGGELFGLLDDLDSCCVERYGRPFIRSIDVLFEPSQALQDLETEARDHPHFIYRICILSGIVDRFDFDSGDGSLNGLLVWLEDLAGSENATELIVTYRMLKRLRRQYPIHEAFETDAEGELTRRSDVVKAEEYFGVDNDAGRSWQRVFHRFVDDTRRLLERLQQET